jgi:hypothetical protein
METIPLPPTREKAMDKHIPKLKLSNFSKNSPRKPNLK